MKIYKKFLNIIYFIWNKMSKMIRKPHFTNDEQKMIEHLKSKYLKSELYEALVHEDKEGESPRGDNFWRNILGGLVILAVTTPIIIKMFPANFSSFWIHVLFPFFSFLLVNRIAYSSGKSTTYGRKLDFFMIAYYVIISVIVIWHFRMFSVRDWDVYISLYISIVVIYVMVKIIEKRVYGRRDIEQMREFLFFKTIYNISSMEDVIESSIWNINDIREYNILYKDSKGSVASLSNCLRFSMVIINKSISVAISKESGRYIFQDEQTIKIHEKLDFIFREVLNFKRIKKDQAGELRDIHRDLWFDYAGAHSKFSEIIRKWKSQIASFVAVGIIITMPAVLVSRIQSDNNLANYLTAIMAAIIGAVVAILFSRKSKHEL